MSKEDTLRKIERDIRNGDLGKARDRLHGLIHLDPNDLSLRKQLGDVYWLLNYPSMAGRYWYLEENKTDNITIAVKLFEKECSNSFELVRRLKFRGDIGALESKYAATVLLKLDYEKYDGQRWQRNRHYPKRDFKDKAVATGCILTLIIILSQSLIGFITVVKRVLEFFRG